MCKQNYIHHATHSQPRPVSQEILSPGLEMSSRDGLRVSLHNEGRGGGPCQDVGCPVTCLRNFVIHQPDKSLHKLHTTGAAHHQTPSSGGGDCFYFLFTLGCLLILNSGVILQSNDPNR